MIKFLNILLVLFLTSCIDLTKKKLDQKSIDQFLYNFSSVNQMVQANIKNTSDLTKVTTEQYVAVLSEIKGKKAWDTFECLKSFDIKEVRSDSKDLYICVYSTEYDYGVCDSTKCGEIELILIKPAEFKDSFEKIINFNCNSRSDRK